MSQDSQSQPQDSDLESPSDSTQRENPQGAPNKLLACYACLPEPLRKALNWMSDNIDIESNWGRGLYIAAYMIVILMHPLHYYAYEINFDQNCLEIVNELNATIAAVVFFNFYMLLYTPNCLKNTFSSNPGSKTAIGHFFFIQIPVLFMTLTVLPYLTTGAKDQIFLAAADLFLFGYILLVIGLSLTIKRATEINGFFAEAKWVKAVFNLFLYLLGGHVGYFSHHLFLLIYLSITDVTIYKQNSTHKHYIEIASEYDDNSPFSSITDKA
ncbi:uncharacterized protein LOC116117892 [Pistacia vera]|uniref:uncharacterized protein LOC116117892 n=1 Tax=Pistacia vera TaxID=55513 RepID=UPI00126346AD|nr:uncharacterized protein LOC116117892 [Pistacia vera]